jgi:hypothetical protein
LGVPRPILSSITSNGVITLMTVAYRS